MKRYLLDFFAYNLKANLTLFETIKILGNKEESLDLFYHLIASQDKWMNRITKKVDDDSLPWYEKDIVLEEVQTRWSNSVSEWSGFIDNLSEQELEKQIVFHRTSDGQKMAVKIIDLALQLNYHSIHHRAQINKLISQQGITPPATDYIFSKLSEV